jgi:hypothetical protein
VLLPVETVAVVFAVEFPLGTEEDCVESPGFDEDKETVWSITKEEPLAEIASPFRSSATRPPAIASSATVTTPSSTGTAGSSVILATGFGLDMAMPLR